MDKKKWETKKIKLGNAIIFCAVAAVVGLLVGVNWNNIAGFLGNAVTGQTHSEVDWSPLDEVYNKLNNTYNGEVKPEEMIEGAKEGMVARLGDIYTVYMDADRSADFYDD